jgi:sec-independent protein translocase protein TatC
MGGKPVDNEGLATMGFVGHLSELRRRLAYAVAAILASMLLAFGYAEVLFEILKAPLDSIPDQKMIALGPLEVFITYLKLALVAGIFISAPVLLYQFWAFLSPGLYEHEKKWVLPFVFLGTVFFVSGGLFAFYVVMPLGFQYLTAMVPDAVVPQYSVEIYFNLVIRLLLAFGIVFETPLVMWVLAAVGLVSPERFASFRKIWIVIAVVLGAVLTPPDPFTQMMMALPLIGFFELGIFGAKFLYKDKNAKESLASGS